MDVPGQGPQKRIRVVLVAYDYPDAMSGPLSWAQRLPLLLRDFGIDVRVLLLHWGNLQECVLFAGLSNSNIDVSAFPFGDTASNTGFLLESIRLNPPDLFIANHVTPALLISGYIRRRGIPTIAVLRSDDAFYHGVVDLVVGGRRRDRVTAVVCVSEYLAAYVRRRNRRMDCARIPSGTPIPSARAVRGGRLRLVYSGRLVEEQKRISETIDCFILACKALPDLEVVILGDGPERSRLEDRVARAGADIRFLGRLPVASMQDELLRCHVIVLLSDYEGLPGAVVEGMACGLVPVCLKMRSGTDELIQHGVNGFVTEDRGAHFLECVSSLHASWDLWSRMSILARESVEKSFSLEVVANRWASIIKRVAQANTQNGAFNISPNLVLPPTHPALACEDFRGESMSALTNLLDRLKNLARKAFLLK